MPVDSTTIDRVAQYLPATLRPSRLTERLEHRLTAPFRRTYAVWLPEE